jgi:cellulose synthase/poly-beta-1,6-N-acetylglucosamine synthase-like glycosyltransferase
MENKNLKVSLIIAVYKNVIALKLILDALRIQTYKNFEVVIAEDDQNTEVKNLLKQYPDLDILHISHPDNGLQKNVIQNKAIAKANGDYLIFIDGDCIPYSTFIEGNVKLAKERRVLSGRRVNLTEKITTKIKSNQIQPLSIEKNYFYYGLLSLAWDKEVRYEQGISINPDGWLYTKLISNRKRNTEILGCNFSCFKKDFLAINGFDESYGEAILGDDTDLTWRFKALGCELYSSKNVANVFHLYHPMRQRTNYDPQEALNRFNSNQSKNKFVCDNGINQYLGKI